MQHHPQDVCPESFRLKSKAVLQIARSKGKAEKKQDKSL